MMVEQFYDPVEDVEDLIEDILCGYDPYEIAEDVLAPPPKPRGFHSKQIIPASRD